MIKLLTTLLMSLWLVSTFGQNPNKTFNWENPGNARKLSDRKIVNIWNYGSDNLGRKSNYNAFDKAVKALGDQGGIIRFRDGVYLFDRGISIPNNIVLLGQGIETTLAFEMSVEMDAISMKGTLDQNQYELSKSAFTNTSQIEVKNASGFKKGELIRISLPNSILTTSGWAKGSIAQITKVKGVNSNSLILEDALRFNFPMNENPIIEKIKPVENAGISCLQIIAQDSTVAPRSTIKLEYTSNCFVKNIISEYCNSAHVEISNSYRAEVSGSYFRLTNDVSNSGYGRGIGLQNSSSNCLIENNIFSFLTHSILLQSGANGNVIAYNYSVNTYWEKPNEASNASADILLFGNYPFGNLFEGNIVQNITIENQNGSNGPYNTFFRNTAELYGVEMKDNSSDSTNFIRNRITNGGGQFGQFILKGKGTYNNENWVKTKIRNDSIPKILRESYYLKDSNKYSLLKAQTNYRIQAEKRYVNKDYVSCYDSLNAENDKRQKGEILNISQREKLGIKIYPNPAHDAIYIDLPMSKWQDCIIYNTQGQLIMSKRINESTALDISALRKGVYLLKIYDETSQKIERLVIE